MVYSVSTGAPSTRLGHLSVICTSMYNLNGDRRRTRTANLRFRNPALCPVELRDRIMSHMKQIASPSIAPDQQLTIDDLRSAVSESKAAADRLNVSLRASTLAIQDLAATLHAMGPLDCATRACEGFGPAPL